MIGVRIPCPDCGLQVELRAVGVGFHPLPPCKTFLKLDLQDFIVLARKKLGIPAPWDTEPS